MDPIKKNLIDIYREVPGVLALSVVEKKSSSQFTMNEMTKQVLVVVERTAVHRSVEHIRLNGERMLLRTVNKEKIEYSITGGENPKFIEWLVRGEILLDREGYLASVRERLIMFPEMMREQKQFIEFSGFLRTYLQAKQELSDGNLLDAYSYILASLHHWAHIVLIDEGTHPELTVWKQLKRVHPGVYKLYEELTASPETLEQRVQLVMLACEFSVMSKMKACCSLLLEIMRSREGPWSLGELQAQPKISKLPVELSLVVQKLVMRGYVREVAIMNDTKDVEALELQYMVET